MHYRFCLQFLWSEVTTDPLNEAPGAVVKMVMLFIILWMLYYAIMSLFLHNGWGIMMIIPFPDNINPGHHHLVDYLSSPGAFVFVFSPPPPLQSTCVSYKYSLHPCHITQPMFPPFPSISPVPYFVVLPFNEWMCFMHIPRWWYVYPCCDSYPIKWYDMVTVIINA